MGVNDKLLTVIEKLDASITNISTLLEATNTLLGTTNTHLENTYAKTSDIFELVNTIKFHTEAIHGWGLDNAIETLKGEILPPILSMDTNLGALRNLYDNFMAPQAENTFHALLDLQRYTLALACLCDLENYPIGLPLDTTPPGDLENHCQRINYMVDMFTIFVNQIRLRVQNGTAVSSSTVAYLLGIGTISGLTEENIPNDIKLGLTAALSGDTVGVFDAMATILDESQAIRELFWLAESAAEAKQLIDDWLDNHNPGGTNGDKAVKALKLIFNSTLLNMLYDQFQEWESGGYDNDTCGAPDSGEYTTMGSIECTLAHTSGDDVYNGVEQPLWYAYIHNQPGNEWAWNNYLICETALFVEGSGYNDSGKLALYAIDAEVWHNRRMKIVEEGIQVEVRLNNNHYYYLNSTSYTRFPVLPPDSAYSIVGTGGVEFHLYYQRLSGGVWTD